MGKRILALILMAVMMLTMGAQAVDTFAVKDTISLSFDGTTAICSARKDAACEFQSNGAPVPEERCAHSNANGVAVPFQTA